MKMRRWDYVMVAVRVHPVACNSALGCENNAWELGPLKRVSWITAAEQQPFNFLSLLFSFLINIVQERIMM